MSNEIQNERDFQAHLMKEHYSKLGYKTAKQAGLANLYPLVDRIGGKDISPDIDLLFIDYGSKVLTGYEFKLLGYKENESNYKRIREGLGEVISYLQLGMDRSYLVLGLPAKTEDLVRAQVDRTFSMIYGMNKLLKMDYLGIMIWCEDSSNVYSLSQRHLQATGNFPLEASHVEIPPGPELLYGRRANRVCMFDLRFHYSRRFIQRYGLAKPGWRPKGY